MSKIKIIAVLLLACFMLNSCVTLLGKGKTISIRSTPSGASVYAEGDYIGTTPFNYTSRSVYKNLTFIKDGYQSKTIGTDTKFRWSVFWNFLFTGVIGFLVDIPYFDKYSSNSYHATLFKEPAPAPVTYTPKPQTVTSTELRPSSYTISRIAQSHSYNEMTAKQIYKKYSSAVFMIYTTEGLNVAQGSGFFVSSDGIGISNCHVFQGSLKGYEVIKLENGSTFKISEILAYSKDKDYIIFKVNGNNLNYIPVTQRGCEIGDKVYAIGSPKGMTNTLSEGLISQKYTNNYIQISVPIDHGSSGGALINTYGEVIGITSGGREDSGANLNFARDIRAIFY